MIISDSAIHIPMLPDQEPGTLGNLGTGCTRTCNPGKEEGVKTRKLAHLKKVDNAMVIVQVVVPWPNYF